MQYIANARSWTGFRKIDPHSPTAEAVGLNPNQCGFESRCGYALIAQSAEAAASNPAQCRFESCSAHQPNSIHLLSLAAQSSAPTPRDPGFESLRRYASLAQLVRASARHAEGPRFKSVRTHQPSPAEAAGFGWQASRSCACEGGLRLASQPQKRRRLPAEASAKAGYVNSFRHSFLSSAAERSPDKREAPGAAPGGRTNPTKEKHHDAVQTGAARRRSQHHAWTRSLKPEWRGSGLLTRRHVARNHPGPPISRSLDQLP